MMQTAVGFELSRFTVSATMSQSCMNANTTKFTCRLHCLLVLVWKICDVMLFRPIYTSCSWSAAISLKWSWTAQLQWWSRTKVNWRTLTVRERYVLLTIKSLFAIRATILGLTLVNVLLITSSENWKLCNSISSNSMTHTYMHSMLLPTHFARATLG